jgi:hypothetical protein
MDDIQPRVSRQSDLAFGARDQRGKQLGEVGGDRRTEQRAHLGGGGLVISVR